MKRYHVRLSDDATRDLGEIYAFIREKSASPAVARAYVARIREFIAGFDIFPKRGTPRDDVREGLRIVGFERRTSVAFLVENESVVILRVLYAGRRFVDDDERA